MKRASATNAARQVRMPQVRALVARRRGRQPPPVRRIERIERVQQPQPALLHRRALPHRHVRKRRRGLHLRQEVRPTPGRAGSAAARRSAPPGRTPRGTTRRSAPPAAPRSPASTAAARPAPRAAPPRTPAPGPAPHGRPPAATPRPALRLPAPQVRSGSPSIGCVPTDRLSGRAESAVKPPERRRPAGPAIRVGRPAIEGEPPCRHDAARPHDRGRCGRARSRPGSRRPCTTR